jgi:hypothetical protein
MPSVAELYNQEVLEGHREALAALRELLAQEKDPLERRKLANAILRAKPVKTRDTEQSKKSTAQTVRGNKARDSLDLDEDLDLDDDLDQDEREAQAMADRVMNAPDPAAALQELQALMNSCAATIASHHGPSETS